MSEIQSFELKPTEVEFTLYQFITLLPFSSIIFWLAFRCEVWIRYSICKCKSAAVISGLLFGHKLVDDVVLSVLITYLTDTWKADNVLIKSITLVNSQKGLSATLVILTVFISDTQIGHLKPIICLSVFYIFGLVVLTAFSLGEFGTQQIIGIVFLAAGKAIVKPLKKFLSDQLRTHEPESKIDENRVKAREAVWNLGAQFLSVAVVFLVVGHLGSWRATFISSTSIILIAFLLFLCGIRFYHVLGPTGSGSPLFHIFLIVKAAFRKRHLMYPDSQNQFFQDVESQPCIPLPQFKCLRWLDKAAVIDPSSSDTPEEQERGHRLFSVTQVKHAKLLLTMLPLWTTFLVFGLGLSTADTLFPEQGNNMEEGISVVLLVILKNLSGSIISSLYKSGISKWVSSEKTKFHHLIRIWVGNLLSVICFFVASWSEVRRLKVVRENGLLDKPKDTIVPMSTWFLAPQFCIFGLMERLAVDGLDDFFREQVPEESFEDCGAAFKEYVIGIGNPISVICVHAAGAWFGNTLNLSRLDKYYMVMGLVCFMNLCFYSYVLTLYRENQGEDQQQQAEPSDPDPLAVPPLNIEIEFIG